MPQWRVRSDVRETLNVWDIQCMGLRTQYIENDVINYEFTRHSTEYPD